MNLKLKTSASTARQLDAAEVTWTLIKEIWFKQKRLWRNCKQIAKASIPGPVRPVCSY